MARDGHQSFGKRNSKLDCFLRRTLSRDRYERIRLYESCVVVSEQENKAFKYVVLTDDSICLTENPPKTIREAVLLKDLQSVELINDYPNFLSGSERENTQHLKILYYTLKPLKKKLSRRLKELPKDSPETEQSTAIMPDSMSTISGSKIVSPQHDARVDIDAYNSLFARKSKLKGNIRNSRKLGESLNEELLGSLARESNNDGETEVLSSSLTGKMADDLWEQHARSVHFSNNVVDFKGKKPDKSRKKFCCFSCLCESFRRKKFGLKKKQNSFDHSHANTESSPIANGTTDKLTTLSLSPRDTTGNLLSEYEKTQWASSSSEMTDFGGQNTSGSSMESDGQIRQSAALDIYLLSQNSPMLMVIRSAWCNYLIKATLDLNIDQSKMTCSTSRGVIFQREKLEQLFGQLKQDLIMFRDNVVEAYNLWNELRVAALKYTVVKKLFWKDSDMFFFLVQQLLKFYHQFSGHIKNAELQKESIDILELISLLVEIVGIMFRETEILLSRFHMLKQDRGKSVRHLIWVFTYDPGVLKGHSQNGDLQHQHSLNGINLDTELKKAFKEFIKVSISTTFELLLMATQAHWREDDKEICLSVGWIMKLLEESEKMEPFVDKIVTLTLELIKPSCFHVLCPTAAIQLYQLFYILKTFLKCSPHITAFIQSSYLEEFKYFVQIHIILLKLPSSYPITQAVVQLIQEVLDKLFS